MRRRIAAGAAVLLSMGLALPTLTACSSPAEEETEQVEQEGEESESGETGETGDPEDGD